MKNINIIIFLFLAVSTTNQVFADNGKTLPGNMCKRMDGIADKIIYTLDGAARNINNLAVWVVCPVIRDEGSRTIRDARVQVRSNNGAPLYCSLSYGNVYNNSGLYVGRFSPNRIVNSSVSFGSINTIPNIAAKDGLYSIRCRLLPGDAIYSYFVLENE